MPMPQRNSPVGFASIVILRSTVPDTSGGVSDWQVSRLEKARVVSRVFMMAGPGLGRTGASYTTIRRIEASRAGFPGAASGRSPEPLTAIDATAGQRAIRAQ